MEKSKFLQVAPTYYALAILALLIDEGRQMTEHEIQEHYTPGTYSYLEHHVLIEQSVLWLRDKGLVEFIADDFGPTIFALSDGYGRAIELVSADGSLPFAKYFDLTKREVWLKAALRNVNDEYRNLEVQAEDFDNPNQEWEPLQLERGNDPALMAAMTALDAAIEQVRADNGYNASFPEERNYVLDGLTNVSRTLRESASTSVAYLRTFALEPLSRVIDRFKGAALSIAASAAKDAIIEFLKEHGVKLLDHFLK